MSVLRAWRKQFIFLMQEDFALDFNVILILIPLCENKSVTIINQVCHTVQQSGRRRDRLMPVELESVSLRPLPMQQISVPSCPGCKWVVLSRQCCKPALSLVHYIG